MDQSRGSNITCLLQSVSSIHTTYFLTYLIFTPVSLLDNAPYFFRWNASTVWPSGSFVRHGKELYKAEGQHNCAEPGNSTQSRFYSFFSDPVHVLGVFLMVQSGNFPKYFLGTPIIYFFDDRSPSRHEQSFFI